MKALSGNVLLYSGTQRITVTHFKKKKFTLCMHPVKYLSVNIPLAVAAITVLANLLETRTGLSSLTIPP